MKIFQDESETHSAAGLEGSWKRKTVPNSIKSRGQENKTEATSWTNQGLKGYKSAVPKPTLVIEKRPEECLDENSEKPQNIIKGLKEVKVLDRPTNQFWMIDDTLQDTSNQRCMYRKNDVYLGIKEVSFEEMKALKWLRESTKKQAIAEIAATAKTPKQKPFSQFVAHGVKAPYQPDFDETFTPPRGAKPAPADDDLVVGFLPETPVNERDRKLSDIQEEETPHRPQKPPKLKLQIYRDESD